MFTLGGERDLLKTIADHRPEADKQLLDAAAGYQAQLVYDNTDVPYTHENGVWLHKVAAFTMIELNAHNIRLDDEFNSDKATHQLIFKLAHGTVGLVAKAASVDVPGLNLAADIGLDALDKATGPSQALLDAQKGVHNSLLLNSMNASLASGYYDHGLITDVPSELQVDPTVDHGPLKDYTTLNDQVVIGSYHRWLYETGGVLKYTDEPLQTATAVMFRVEHALGAH